MPVSEFKLENELIKQLESFGYEKAQIKNENDLIKNLKKQLEIHNKTIFSDREFSRILTHLNSGTIFERAKKLRDKFLLERDDGSHFYVEFFNTVEWCKNQYQVANQITMKGKYKNRYDVTLLVNGLPLVQIELKRAGVEIKEAFNQVQRYHRHSFAGTLFDYIQIFVISNKANTKYFANNPKQSFEQTFYWTDEDNNRITNLFEFAESFLRPCFISKIIANYVVLAEAKQILMVLRPYQYYAVERIINRVKNTDKNGYIWHTTGSGKTLTSFKASQIISQMPEIKKVLFVVDRKDLDIQTVKEFNSFSEGSVDSTENTKKLVQQLKDDTRKLIVTTIQKLDRAIKNKENYKHLENEKILIIFDECHRSQFGKTHANIRKAFKKAQLIGFTGTPIFAENNVGGVTTKDVFDECLHKYVITDAISNGNVLGFSVEYIGRYRKKDSDVIEADIEPKEVSKEVLESDKRIEKIVDYILSIHKQKTKNKTFNAILATSSTNMAMKYYNTFKKKNHDLKIATIFTFKANEEISDMLDIDPLGEGEVKENKHIREQLEEAIKDYNEMFNTNFSTENFYDYYRDVQKRVKDLEIDILIVVSMFLTGFDSPPLNTLYVDKNLRYHGLIQAYSRTNRLLDARKPHGNIVCFRDLKEETDKALELFGNKEAKEIVFKKPYNVQKEEFIKALKELKKMVQTPADVDKIKSEKEKLKFVKKFRKLMRIKSSLETFVEFNWKDIQIDEEEYFEYLSKYVDIYVEIKNKEDKEETPLEEIDFSLELIREDLINYDYIVNLLKKLKKQQKKDQKEYEKQKTEFLKKFDRDLRLKIKKELVERFVEEKLPEVEDVEKEFEEFWNKEKEIYLMQLAKEYNLDVEKLKKLIDDYFYTGRFPVSNEIKKTLNYTPKLLEWVKIKKVLKDKIRKFIQLFEEW
ncbi:type I restriction endonuclease subunit R [Persephonella sp.]